MEKRIDRDMLNHPRHINCVFQHTITSLNDCLTVLEETGSVEDAIEYQGEEEERAIRRVIEVASHIAFYGDEEEQEK
jgi:ABC-type dipeptide/oligopeptide/nickel transport system ATPase component